MYIAIEGIKGSGKSTLLDALCARLEKEGVDFALLAPTRPVPGRSLMEWLARRLWLRERDVFRRHLYAWRSNAHARQLRMGAPLVLGDRSLLTSLATRWPEAEVERSAYVADVRGMEWRIPWPDRVIYLDVPLTVVEGRLHGRCRDYGKRDECAERLLAADRAYREMAARGEGWELPVSLGWEWCDASRPAPEVLEDVYGRLRAACPGAWPDGAHQ